MAKEKEEVVIIDEDGNEKVIETKEEEVKTKKGFHPIEFVKGVVKKHPAIVGVSAASVGMALAYVLGGKIQGGPHTVVNNYDFGNSGSTDDEEDDGSDETKETEEDEE